MRNIVNPNPKFWNRKRVLLTGHTGFKGAWLTLWLKELGAEITGLSLQPNTSPNLFDQLFLDEQIHHHIGDIRDQKLLNNLVQNTKPNVVLHLAAQPLVQLSYEYPLETWSTNLMGTLNLLEALRQLEQDCTAVFITTDKVYRNNEWIYGYRENDPLGGHDPYSSSKAAAEIAIESWRSSFCGALPHQTPHLRIASARAGNVIGGGDWAGSRIMPDVMRALSEGKPIGVRNPSATRPWQHVLEPLSGYLSLAENLAESKGYAKPYNFGPLQEANRSVKDLVEETLRHWPGSWKDVSNPQAPHEASLLSLVIDRAHRELIWAPRWNFETTVERTVNWYRHVAEGKASVLECCRDDLTNYLISSAA